MRGEELEEAFIAFSGVYGDRLFAFRSSAAPKGFPYLTGREQEALLLYRPRFRDPKSAAKPPNLREAEGIEPGLNPVFADPGQLMVDVETPSGDTVAVDNAALIGMLEEESGGEHRLTLLRSERAMTDCRPVSLFALQTAKQLAEEVGLPLDKRRFRANIYVDLESGSGFGEDPLVGERLGIGGKAVVAVLERDPRCKMITLDPDTAEQSPEVLRTVARSHEGMAGVYGAVLVEGTVRKGDPIEVLS
jgi:uncharacterized protein YcbX